mmetsp:Transcript_31959/g.46572  ORF Transcript_31959/g.46572 Transcript_31959/m.46572 type:complete len:621 (+) Transcript_31959:96-1958(+)
MSGARQLFHLSKSLPLPHLKQGSTLSIRCPSNIKLPFNVKIFPEWRDDARLSLRQTLSLPSSAKNGLCNEEKVIDMDITTKQNEDGKMTSMGRVENHILVDIDWKKYGIVASGNDDAEVVLETAAGDDAEMKQTLLSQIVLEATIPEKCNVTCELLSGGNISIPKGKIEGDVNFCTSHGNIYVPKLRGYNISLTAAASTSLGPSSSVINAEAEKDDKMDRREVKGQQQQGGIIHVTHVVEAKDVNLTAEKRVRAKMINGSNVNVNLNRKNDKHDEYSEPLDNDDGLALIDIGSLYASSAADADGARLSVTHDDGDRDGQMMQQRKGSDIRIKSHHGHASVRTTATPRDDKNTASLDNFGNRIPLIDLGGVNGSCDVGIEHQVQKNTSNANNTDAELSSSSSIKANTLAARVHIDSLSPESISLITSNNGDVELTVDRKVESDIRLLSCPQTTLNDLDVDSYLAEEEEEVLNSLKSLIKHSNDKYMSEIEPSAEKISIETKAFTTTNQISRKGGFEYVEGYVENKSHEPDSRFDVRNQVSVGKIRIDDAASQALKGFSSSNSGSTVNRPLLAVAASDDISVETVSWFGAIARRYGMEDGGRELGRQARAGGAKSRPKERSR